jgi:hypothetical protein
LRWRLALKLLAFADDDGEDTGVDAREVESLPPLLDDHLARNVMVGRRHAVTVLRRSGNLHAWARL